MSADLVVPVVLLILVLAAAPVILLLDTRDKRLEQRVGLVASLSGGADADSLQNRSIRREQTGGNALQNLAQSILRVPIDLPKAHVLPAGLVVGMAIFVGGAAGMAARYFDISLPLAVSVGSIVGCVLARGVFGWELNNYQAKLLAQLPDALELVVNTTRAGLPVAEAIRAIAREMPEPTRGEFLRAGNDITLGASPDEVLVSMHRRTRLLEYAIFGVTVAVQTRSGGRLSESVMNLADIVRQRATVAAKAKALSAEARLSARILTLLPFVGGISMSVINPSYLDPLFSDPRGKEMLMIGIGTLVMGAITMRWLVNSVVKE